MTENDALDSDNFIASTVAEIEDVRQGLDRLSGLVAGGMSMDELLAQVALAAEDAIPEADGVGVTLLRLRQKENRVETRISSADFVAAVDRVQYELVDEGPCITAALERQTVSSGSIGGDRRWPRFGPRVGRLGVHSVLSLPMLLPNGDVVGALNAYAFAKDAFDPRSVSLGQLFAAPAGIAVHNSHVLAEAQAQAAQLQAAMASRAVIDQAIGVLRSRTGASADECFARLRTISQNGNVKLVQVAERVLDEAVRRARARQVPHD